MRRSKQIIIEESKNVDTIQDRVNKTLVYLYDEGVASDDIDILCNITNWPTGTYYTYTIIYVTNDDEL